MDPNAPFRGRRLFVALAVLLAVGMLPAAVSAQVVCEKTPKSGKVKYNLRDACNTGKGEIEAADFAPAPRASVEHFVGEGAVFGTLSQPTAIDGDATSVQAVTSAASTDLVVVLHAECQSSGSLEWVDVDVKVDGVARGSTAHPNGFDAFCGGTHYATRSVTVVAEDLPAGPHTVTVEARDTGGAGALGDVGLTLISVPD